MTSRQTVMSEQYFDPNAQDARSQRIPVWRWTLWHVCLAAGMLIFYVLLTPLWREYRIAKQIFMRTTQRVSLSAYPFALKTEFF